MGDALKMFREEGRFSSDSLDPIRKDRKKRGGRH